jgi:hypothetical protein
MDCCVFMQDANCHARGKKGTRAISGDASEMMICVRDRSVGCVSSLGRGQQLIEWFVGFPLLIGTARIVRIDSRWMDGWMRGGEKPRRGPVIR